MGRFMKEEWKIIKQSNYYQVSNLGRVMGLKRGIILKPFPDSWGYPTVDIHRKKIKVHMLVAEAFMDEKQPKMQIDHIDRNKWNNYLNNLRYVTQSENRYNMNSYKDSKSNYKGVSWHKASNKWTAKIRKNKKDRYIGLFESEIEAALAYDKIAYKIDPIHSKLNFSIDAILHNDSVSWQGGK